MPELAITYDLMQHYKVLKTVSKQRYMQALCDENGKAFLAIGDDGKLRVTSDDAMHVADSANLAGQGGSPSGWQQTELSKDICEQVGENAVVKTFSVGENRLDGKHVLCAVVSGGRRDAVFYSLSKSLTSPRWQRVQLPEEIAPLPIDAMQVNSYGDDVYILLYAKQPGDRLQRYFLRSVDGDFSEWSFEPLAVDFDRIDSSVMGCPQDEVQGSYTLGSIKSKCQLLFTPSYDDFTPGSAPPVARLALPQAGNPERLAALAAPDSGGATDVFACGGGLLSVYAYTAQQDGATPVTLCESEHFTGVLQLFAFESKARAYVWLLGDSGELCYLYADIRRRYDPAAWSVVMVLRDGLDYVHLFEQGGHNAFYAYTSEGRGILGYEDATSGFWRYEDVFTAVDIGEPVPMRVFVTQIKTAKPGATVFLKAGGSGLFEIGARIYALEQDAGIHIKSNAMGVIRIVQLTELFSAIPFEITHGTATTFVDPSKDTGDKLFSLDRPEKLRDAKIQVAGECEVQPLLPENASAEEIAAAAEAIASLSTQQKRLNGANIAPLADSAVRLRCSGNGLRIIRTPVDDMALLADLSDDAGEYGCEDVFGWLRSQRSPRGTLAASNGWFDIIIKTVGKVCRFIVQTVKKTIYFIIDTVEKVVASVKEILTILVTDPGKILDFLKYMFSFADIARTQRYMKTLVNAQLAQCGALIDQIQGMMDKAFLGLESDIAKWAGLDASAIPKEAPADMQAIYASAYSDGDVHANYFSGLVADNAGHANGALQADMTVSLQANGLSGDILEQLGKFAAAEGDAMRTVATEIEQVIHSLQADTQLDLADIFKKLLAILAKGVLASVRGVADLIFDIVKCLLNTVIDVLNHLIYIPCISEFLQMLGIDRFSLLDVLLFVPSFAGTIVFKLLNGRAPVTDADIAQLTVELESSSCALQGLQLACESNAGVDFKELFTGLILFFEAFVALGGAATALLAAIIGLVVAVLEMPSLPAGDADNLELVAFYFAFLGIYVAFISVYFATVSDSLVQRVFAGILILFFLVTFVLNTVLLINDFAVKALSPVLDTLKAIIDNIITATEMDAAKPDAALVLRAVRTLAGAAGGLTLLTGAISVSENAENPAPILV